MNIEVSSNITYSITGNLQPLLNNSQSINNYLQSILFKSKINKHGLSNILIDLPKHNNFCFLFSEASTNIYENNNIKMKSEAIIIFATHSCAIVLYLLSLYRRKKCKE